jgi:quaternary ammonium compound-resistance protein SugE
MHWIYLFIASLFEICWIYSLKFLDWNKIKLFRFDNMESAVAFIPLVGYIAFGIGNVVFYSMAMKTISASTTFAIWTGMALLGSKIVDISVFKEPYSGGQIFFMGVVLIGIIGLQMTSVK